jgi:sialic acid synthase SpsE
LPSRAKHDYAKDPTHYVALPNGSREERWSLFAASDIPAGARIEALMLSCLRPGTGIAPVELSRVVGKRARRAFRAGEMLSWEGLGE